MQQSIKDFLQTILIGNNNALDFLDALIIEKNEIFCTFKDLTPQNLDLIESHKNEIISNLKAITTIENIYIAYSNTAKQSSLAPVNKQIPPNIKKIITVLSGKGGVGKSSIAVHLAYALNHIGLKVGVLDGDIYGPSIPLMFGIQGFLEISQEHLMIPLVRDDILLASLGFMLDSSQSVILKGPMIIKTFNQLLMQTTWGDATTDVDVLIIDLPPGTGDIHINVFKNYEVAGAVMVSTPQNVALLDVQKTFVMLQNLSINILGMIENMSYFNCPYCGKISHVFAESGAKIKSLEYNIAFLGEIPLDLKVREYLDNGTNIIKENLKHPISRKFIEIALQLKQKLFIKT